MQDKNTHKTDRREKEKRWRWAAEQMGTLAAQVSNKWFSSTQMQESLNKAYLREAKAAAAL